MKNKDMIKWTNTPTLDLEAMEKIFRTSSDFKDHTMDRFHHFCKANGFTEVMPVRIFNPAAMKDVLMDGNTDSVLQMCDAIEAKRSYEREPNAPHPANLFDHTPAMFRNPETGKICIVTNPYPPVIGDKEESGAQTRNEWMNELYDFADKYGVRVQVFPDASYYWKDTMLVVFSLNGDIRV